MSTRFTVYPGFHVAETVILCPFSLDMQAVTVMRDYLHTPLSVGHPRI